MDMLEVALKYRKRGWAVVPCHLTLEPHSQCTCGNDDCKAQGKHPRVRWVRYAKILPTINEVKTWFSDDFYESNIGVVTGIVSDLVVVDLDGQQGLKSFKEYLELTTKTLTARTGGGGRHLFFRANGQVMPSRVKIFPGVDVRAENGFIVLPPSCHKSGRKYEWLNDLPIAKVDLSVLKPDVNSKSGNGAGESWYSELLQGVSEGVRNEATMQLAGRYFNKGLSFEEVTLIMNAWNQHNDPPQSSKALLDTIKSIQRKHQQNTEITSYGDLLAEFTIRGEKP